jgi:hypothetical protein
MSQRRYRIRFIARFDHLITAEDDAAARRMAEELSATKGHFIQDAAGGTFQLQWNTIEFLTNNER